VKIQVRHGDEGAEKEGFEIERVKVDAPPLEIRTVDNVHHFRITKIAPAAVEAVKAGLVGIGPGKSIVLDLRGNPGGDYEDAVRLAELFLPKGVGISKLQKLSGEKREVSRNVAPYEPSKLSILQDGNTASGAELVIAALAQFKPLRARTYGLRSFGKGVVQVEIKMPGDSGILRLTDAKMFGPNNEDWDRKGLDPDEDLPPEFAR
jgi:carboxyl-terminal processing protease